MKSEKPISEMSSPEYIEHLHAKIDQLESREAIDKIRCRRCNKALATISMYIQPKDSMYVWCEDCVEERWRLPGARVS